MFHKYIQTTVSEHLNEKSSEHLKSIDAANTIVMVDSHNDNGVVQLMCAEEVATAKRKLYCRMCLYITFFYVILIFFSVIFVFICLHFDSA